MNLLDITRRFVTEKARRKRPAKLRQMQPPMTGGLSKDQVEERLKKCEDPQVVDEIYQFGQMLLKDAIQNLHSLDTKAVWFAGYGTAIVTLLVSSFGSWSRFADRLTDVLAFAAAFAAFRASIFSVTAIRLQDVDLIGEAEWLQPECLSKIHFLKRFRVLTMWRTIDSVNAAHAYKTVQLRKSEGWLKWSVGLLLVTFFEMLFSHVFGKFFKAWKVLLAQGYSLGLQLGHNLVGGSGLHGLALSLYSLSPNRFAGLALRFLVWVRHISILAAWIL
jgi:hypothetical protein